MARSASSIKKDLSDNHNSPVFIPCIYVSFLLPESGILKRRDGRIQSLSFTGRRPDLKEAIFQLILANPSLSLLTLIVQFERNVASNVNSDYYLQSRYQII